MARPVVVVLGASGFLGRNVLRAAAGETVVAVSRDPSAHGAIGGARWISAERWPAEVLHLRTNGPVVVINAAGLTDHAYCETHADEAMRVNGHAVRDAALTCRNAGVPLVHISTDGLFARTRPGDAPHYWSLTDVPDPVSAYARSKLAGERALAELGWGHALRMSFAGPSLGTGRGLIAFLAKRLRGHANIEGFVDVWFTPAPAQGAAMRLLAMALAASGGHSIRHWGSAQAITKHDYLSRVAVAAGLAPRMTPVHRASLPGAESVQFDQSLTCEDPWSTDELIALGAQALRAELV
ncbi:MAG TPA: sugar nucleotide-binding protein [Gemmatimonadaceae bacterium]